MDDVEDGEAEDHGQEVQNVEIDFVRNSRKQVSTIEHEARGSTHRYPSHPARESAQGPESAAEILTLQQFDRSVDASHHDHQRTEKDSRKHDHPPFSVRRLLRCYLDGLFHETALIRSVGEETKDKICAESDEDDNRGELEDDTGDHWGVALEEGG